MNTVFIVRPFGTKQGVDFNKVDAELIQPALQALGLRGQTTEAIIEQGNIREDMFAQLLLADLVIADMSIHNANVFYELGIRHALRDKKTFLIRCSVDGHDVPFDLKTDRYLNYIAADPGAAINALTKALDATLYSDKQDSPVFYMLPKLVAQDPELFLAVPQDFGEEVTIAAAAKDTGKLALLAYEASGFAWEIPAMRKLGEALYALGDLEAAEICWLKVTDRYTNDDEANDRLSTIYQRQADELLQSDRQAAWELLSKSDIAIERLLKDSEHASRKLSEILALKARNAKTRWVDTWRSGPQDQWQANALKSTYLIDAYKLYDQAFIEDLDHIYSGINVLGLLVIIITLAEALPDVFALEYDNEDEAADALKKYRQHKDEQAALVQGSVRAQQKKTYAKPDVWVDLTEAELACLTSSRPLRAAGLYQKAIQECSTFNFSSSEKQLLIYDELGVQPANVKEALKVFDTDDLHANKSIRQYLLFTGHMIDKAGRAEPRFPAAIEPQVRAAIKAAVQEQVDKYGDRLCGLSGGACGGDIIFHEVCAELGVASELYLLLPREQFIVESVQFAGHQWVDRFDDLYQRLPKHFLCTTKELPKWLKLKPGYSIWERNNLWMLHSALICGGIHLSLIALWDGQGGDGPGGTGHMVKEAKARGARTVVIDIESLH